MTYYLDNHFDVASISALSHHERASFKPIYSMNKWWARRSSSVFRAILLGLHMQPAANLMDGFYTNHQNDHSIQDKIILDPFMGGGVAVVEALRLGYKAIGVDLNPLAWFIVKTETMRVDLHALHHAFTRIDEKIASTIRSMYVTRCPCCQREAEIIYTFWVKVAPCPELGCGVKVPLFRDYIIGKRRGEIPIRYYMTQCPSCQCHFDRELDCVNLTPDLPVSQEHKLEQETKKEFVWWSYASEGDWIRCPCCRDTFESSLEKEKLQIKRVALYALLCPQCESVFSHGGPIPHQVQCPQCLLFYNPHHGTTSRGGFSCSRGHEHAIMESMTANGSGEPLDFHAYAIEGYCQHCAQTQTIVQDIQGFVPGVSAEQLSKKRQPGCSTCQATNHKFFKKLDQEDVLRYKHAAQEWERSKEHLPWPRQPINDYEKTNRLIIHNYKYWYQLFNQRQLIALTMILREIMLEPDQSLKETLLSAFLGTLEHQNMLNIYYVPYAQSAGAFGRYDFHPKVMVCEGNPWGGQKGRGTWLMVYDTIIHGKKYLLNPYEAIRSKGNWKNVYTSDEFSGYLTTDYNELKADNKNLILTIRDSRDLSFIPSNSIDHVVTDPPYADSVQYAELSDFFYVWLRIALQNDYPEVFHQIETPKQQEIVENIRRKKEITDFHGGLQGVFNECYRVLKPGGRLVFTFHHSKIQQWIALLETLLQSRFVLVSAYPVKSEATGSGNLVFHSNTNNVAYDIIHVCQKIEDCHTNTEQIHQWEDLKSYIKERVKNHIIDIRSNKKDDSWVIHADIRIMLWGECLAIYSQKYRKIMDEKDRHVSIARALEECTCLIEELLLGE